MTTDENHSTHFQINMTSVRNSSSTSRVHPAGSLTTTEKHNALRSPQNSCHRECLKLEVAKKLSWPITKPWCTLSHHHWEHQLWVYNKSFSQCSLLISIWYFYTPLSVCSRKGFNFIYVIDYMLTATSTVPSRFISTTSPPTSLSQLFVIRLCREGEQHWTRGLRFNATLNGGKKYI